jgi:hypothetical protein
VRAIVVLVLGLLAGVGSADAICVKDANRTDEQELREAKYVFVALIESAEIETPRDQLKDGRPYTVKYRYSVVRSFKGTATDIPYLVTGGYYNHPSGSRYRVFAEQDRFVPGDSVLVVTSEAAPASISWIGCSNSRPWDQDARELVKKVFRDVF